MLCAETILGMLAIFLPSPAADEAPQLKVVKLDQFKKAIAAHRGKVIVVDIWQTTCEPCKREFPNLVEMHKRHDRRSFAAVSLNLDDPSDMELRTEAVKFLKKVNAVFENYLLDEEMEVWQKEFGITLLPCVLVYGKDGKLVRKFTSEGAKEVDYKEIQQLVRELLEK